VPFRESISSIAAKLKEKLKNEFESQSGILISYEAANLLLNSLGEHYHTEPETLTWLQNFALHDQHGWVRWAAVESIGKYYIQTDGVFELLCQIASQDPSPPSYFNPIKAALEALVKHCIDRPEVIELLRDRSTQDPDEELRKWAEEQLKNII
jgi:hypothetical protein